MADTVAAHELIDQVKEAALAAIQELVNHHVKGADLLQKGFNQMTDIATEVADWYEILKSLLTALKPFFQIIETWLKEAYAHLVDIFNWAKKMWHEIFG
jgi:hypothetical protein